MEVDLTTVSTQGGEDGTVQDTAESEHRDHPVNAPNNGAVENKPLSYADHFKILQSLAGGTVSLDEVQGLDQTVLEKPTNFLHHVSVIQEGIQAIYKHYSDMQTAWASMSHHCTSVQKNCSMPIVTWQKQEKL